MKIILASASPRRKDLLGNMGVKFEIIVSDCDEDTEKTNPCDIVMEISERKANAVLALLDDTYKKDCLIIAADTLVFYNGRQLGKPADKADAVRMLGLLSGQKHNVITGVTLIKCSEFGIECHSFYDDTQVTVSELNKKEIEEYIETGEPMDKAGSYAIQGKFAKFVENIEGDYSNVVGLPVSKLYRELKNKNWI